MKEISNNMLESYVKNSSIPVLVDFYFAHCKPCMEMMPFLEELAAEMAGRVEFVKVDALLNRVDMARLKVTAAPTIVLHIDGQEKMRWEGARSKEFLRFEIEQVVARHVESLYSD